jgi:hypothetical protein
VEDNAYCTITVSIPLDIGPDAAHITMSPT